MEAIASFLEKIFTFIFQYSLKIITSWPSAILIIFFVIINDKKLWDWFKNLTFHLGNNRKVEPGKQSPAADKDSEQTSRNNDETETQNNLNDNQKIDEISKQLSKQKELSQHWEFCYLNYFLVYYSQCILDWFLSSKRATK